MSLAVLTGLRILSLSFSQTDLFFDEAQYWAWAQEPAFGYFSKPPLIAWSIWSTTSLCGDGEACVRLSSPLFHAGSAIFLFLAARELFDARTGFWSAIVFATLPGISFSSNIVSTDVPLLFFWSAALYFGIRLIQDRNWSFALLLAVAIGLGALSKYAMLYFYLCAAIWFAVEPRGRWLLKDWKGAALIAIPLLFLAPNIGWNLQHGLVTFSHTADNAGIGGIPVHPVNMLEFILAQCGVFGPVLFPMLIWIAIRAIRQASGEETKLLLSFSIPIVLLVTVLAFLSRAHANWAATAFPAATILVVATMLMRKRMALFAATLAVNAIAFVALTVGPVVADQGLIPGKTDPYARMLGWRQLGEETRKVLSQHEYGTIVTDDRQLVTELLYYLGKSDVPIRAWRRPGPPHDHFELTRPFSGADAEPVLLVTLRGARNRVDDHFETVREIKTVTIPAGPKSKRRVTFEALENFKGIADEE
ncbi:glycosyltransferase family 39 protein [Methyloligella sp. 2.7D]|uniref:ArnT family glycosyltransferase n=1 Tax=unclassified Methyloligella TaxID=2625955 RepID=UPI00157C1146|nr:glycosyltransferase family 39 protein [Methyloligella sp. GL2]QKP76613.1 glycosyltransferase family 39 protein [Methyloligella sp. GL2]